MVSRDDVTCRQRWRRGDEGGGGKDAMGDLSLGDLQRLLICSHLAPVCQASHRSRTSLWVLPTPRRHIVVLAMSEPESGR